MKRVDLTTAVEHCAKLSNASLQTALNSAQQHALPCSTHLTASATPSPAVLWWRYSTQHLLHRQQRFRA
jgi:hypothetical protein